MTIESRGEQTGREVYVGVAFLLMFTSFNSLQNILSKVYNDYGYDRLGETSILLIYFCFGFGTLFTPFLIRKQGYRRVFFFSSLGYIVFEGAGLLITLWEEMPRWTGWAVVVSGAVVCGFSASALWVGVGSYVNEVAGDGKEGNRKTELNGIFYSLFMSSQITGSLLTTLVLGLMDTKLYFICLTAIGCILCGMQ